MKKYLVEEWCEDIEEINVNRETDKCVFVIDEFGQQKMTKTSTYRKIFDTWQEAKNHLISRELYKISSLERRLKGSREKLSKIESLRQNAT